MATVVSVDVFSSLEAIALERAPFFVTGWMARQAFARAEAVASFDVDAIDIVAGAGHSQSLGVPEVWTEINEWTDRTVPRPNP